MGGSPTSRLLVAAALVNWTGAGAWLATWVVFSDRFVDIGTASVGLIASVGVGLGVLGSVSLGALIDRRDAVPVFAATLALQGVAGIAMALDQSLWVFVPAAAVALMMQTAGTAVRSGYIPRAYIGDERVDVQARLRVTANLGLAVGTGLAAVALAGNARWPFQATFAFYGVTALVAALVAVRLPRMASAPVRAGERAERRLPHGRFTLFSILSGVLAMNDGLLAVGIPLWVVGHTDAPQWTVAAVLVLNTIGVVALQMRVTRWTKKPSAARTTSVASGLLLATSCLLLWASGGQSATVAVLLLLACTVVHLLGELSQAAAGWCLAFAMAPEARQGTYQGFYSASQALAQSIAPLLVTGVVLPLAWGWGGLAALFAAAGLLTPLVAIEPRERRPAAGFQLTAEAGER
jgi:MFS family permease